MTSQRMMARFGRWLSAILVAVAASVTCLGVEAAGYTWSGSGSNALWGTGGNWQGGSAPVSDASSTTLVFTGTTQTSSTNATSLFGVSQLRFANPPQTVTKTFSWSGTGNEGAEPSYNQAFTGTGGFTYTPSLAIGGTVSASGTSNNGLVDLSISFRNATTGTSLGTFVNATGGVVSYASLVFQYDTSLNAFVGPFNMGGSTVLYGNASAPPGKFSQLDTNGSYVAETIANPPGLVVSGSGVTSSIAPFTLSGSSVQFGVGGSIVTESPVGYSSLTDTIALNVVTTSGVLDVTLGGTAGGVRNLAISGVVSGSAGLGLTGASSSAGLLTLSANNTYSGLTAVGSGTLQVGAGGTSGSIAGDIVDNATLVFNRSDALTSAGSISGSGAVVKLGAGVLSLTGSNTYTGLTTISAGTLSIGAGGTSGSITGGIVDNSTLVFNRSDSLTYAGAISGSGAVVKQGSGVLTLTGSNSYSGLTTVAGGALNIQNSAALGSSAAGAVVNAGAALELQGGLSVAAESLLLSGSGVSGGGALRNISGTNTYSGAVTLAANSRINSDAGRLVLNSGTITGAGYGLTVGGAGDTVIGSSINTGAGTLTKDGSGRLTLTGSSSYAGLTRINAGVLNVQNASALGGTTAGTLVDASATLELQGGISVTGEALSLQGAGVSGGGALRNVSGTNTFSGPVTLANDSRINTDAGLLVLTSSTIGSTLDGLGLTVGGAGDTAIGSSILLGAGGLAKDGSGTLTISGTSNYSGATAVNAGGLVVTGQLGNTAVTVEAGARLAGDGTILGSVTVADSGTLSIGSLGGSPYGDLAVGSLLLGGSVSTATTLMDIQGSGNQAGTAGVNYDSLVVSNPGGLTYGGALGLTFWNTQAFSDWTVFHLFDFTGTAHEDFESISSLAAVESVYGGLVFNGSGASGAWTAEVGNGQSLVFYEATGSLVVVPEPSTIFGAVLGIGIAAWRYRRQRHLKRSKQAALVA